MKYFKAAAMALNNLFYFSKIINNSLPRVLNITQIQNIIYNVMA